jgi:hypothetical protein
VAHYRTTIASTMTPADALAYLAEFTSAAIWDPSVILARGLDEGPVAVGARFLIVSRVNGRDVPLEYEIVALDDARVVLRAESARLTGVDTITVEPAPSGSSVTYDADLALIGAARLLDPLLALVFRRMAGRAADGLRAALQR